MLVYVGYCEACDLGRVSRSEAAVEKWGLLHVRAFIRPRADGKKHEVAMVEVEVPWSSLFLTAKSVSRSTP